MSLGTIGARIAWLASQVGSQTELARLSGIQRRAITRYISGENCPREDSIRALAAAGGISETWLRDGGPTPDVTPPRGLRSRIKRALVPSEADDSFRPIWLGSDSSLSGPAIYTLSKVWAREGLKVRHQDIGIALVKQETLLIDTSAAIEVGPSWLARVTLADHNPTLDVGSVVSHKRRGKIWIDDLHLVEVGTSEVLGRVVARLRRA